MTNVIIFGAYSDMVMSKEFWEIIGHFLLPLRHLIRLFRHLMTEMQRLFSARRANLLAAVLTNWFRTRIRTLATKDGICQEVAVFGNAP